MTEERDDSPLKAPHVEDQGGEQRSISTLCLTDGGLLDDVYTVDMSAAQFGLEGYNFVLMGLQTVGQDGLTSIREIKVRAGAKGIIPVFVVTGDAGARIRSQARESGDDDPSSRLPAMDHLFEAIGQTLLARAEKRTVAI